jgi:hypothetical protein
MRSSGGLKPDIGSHNIIPVVISNRVVHELLSNDDVFRAVTRANPNVGGSLERPAYELLSRLKDSGEGHGNQMLVVYASNAEVYSLNKMARAVEEYARSKGDAGLEKVAGHVLRSLSHGEQWFSKKTSEM